MLSLWTVIAAADEPRAAKACSCSATARRSKDKSPATTTTTRSPFPTAESACGPSTSNSIAARLEEGYQRKRAAMAMDNVQDHLELAQWCQRHGLYRFAADELAAAAAHRTEPSHAGRAATAGLLIDSDRDCDRLEFDHFKKDS